MVFVIGLLNLTVKRLKLMEEHGYFLTRMELICIRRWFGTSVLVLFEKDKKGIIDFDTEWYGEKVKN